MRARPPRCRACPSRPPTGRAPDAAPRRGSRDRTRPAPRTSSPARRAARAPHRGAARHPRSADSSAGRRRARARAWSRTAPAPSCRRGSPAKRVKSSRGSCMMMGAVIITPVPSSLRLHPATSVPPASASSTPSAQGDASGAAPARVRTRRHSRISTPRTLSLQSFQAPPSMWKITIESTVLPTKPLSGLPVVFILTRATANSSSCPT